MASLFNQCCTVLFTLLFGNNLVWVHCVSVTCLKAAAAAATHACAGWAEGSAHLPPAQP